MVLPFALIKNNSRPAVPQRNQFSTSVLQEALRLNPFGTRTDSSDNRVELTRRAQEEESERKELNEHLATLSRLFPDIQFEVLREILVKFDGDSRLQICVEELLRHRAQWVKGRLQAPPRNIDDKIPLDVTFRSSEYKSAVRQLLTQEFRYLSKSTVEGVLAENNYCYTRARPTLSALSNRTWRATIGNLNIFRKKKENDAPPSHLVEKSKRVEGGPLTETVELDDELQEWFFQPARRVREETQQAQDYKLAEELNESEARKANALYECECCCSEVTFERMSSCSTNAHMICFDCIRRTAHEALFGQGWGRSVDADRGALKCLAPLVDDVCTGCISPLGMRQAILAERSGSETWAKFEDRLAQEALLSSQLKIIRCPFCSYAEADPTHYSSSTRTPTWHVRPAKSITAVLATLILLDFLPLLLFLVIILSALRLVKPSQMFQISLANLSLRSRSPRFKCCNPSCLRISCLKCQKAWHDPHTCHEPLLISLRTTVEAARTAAIKRTCPRCGLSFVKSSGCNKLTCVCGYSMCYLCRTALGSPSSGQPAAADVEGYRHFCEHFRVNPGKPCTQCSKCDLYKSEDEDTIVKRAGEIAEKEWRVKEGMVGVEGLGEMPGQEGQGWLRRAFSGNWTLQGVVDWVVGQLVEVEF